MQISLAANPQFTWEFIVKASDSFALLLILMALSYAVSIFVAN